MSVQELVFSMQASDTCLSEMARGTDPLECIGASASLCLDATDGGYTRLGALGCYEAELANWESRIAHSYKQAQDSDNSAGAGSWPEIHASFIRHRDASCKDEGAKYSGESPLEEEMHVVAWCKLQATGQHAMFMRDMVQWLGED